MNLPLSQDKGRLCLMLLLIVVSIVPSRESNDREQGGKGTGVQGRD